MTARWKNAPNYSTGYWSGSGGSFASSSNVQPGDFGIVTAGNGDGRHVLGTPTWGGLACTPIQVTFSNGPHQSNAGMWYIASPPMGTSTIAATAYNARYNTYLFKGIDLSDPVGDSSQAKYYGSGGGGSPVDNLRLSDIAISFTNIDQGASNVGDGTTYYINYYAGAPDYQSFIYKGPNLVDASVAFFLDWGGTGGDGHMVACVLQGGGGGLAPIMF